MKGIIIVVITTMLISIGAFTTMRVNKNAETIVQEYNNLQTNY